MPTPSRGILTPEIRTVTTLQRKPRQIAASIKLYERSCGKPASTWHTSRRPFASSPPPPSRRISLVHQGQSRLQPFCNTELLSRHHGEKLNQGIKSNLGRLRHIPGLSGNDLPQ
jgi:hypothetical protein